MLTAYRKSSPASLMPLTSRHSSLETSHTHTHSQSSHSSMFHIYKMADLNFFKLKYLKMPRSFGVFWKLYIDLYQFRVNFNSKGVYKSW